MGHEMMAMALVLVLTNPLSLTTLQAEEIHKVEARLLAPCCYTQSIAEHGSDIAVQMRREVTEMVAEGKTEEEIVNYYRDQYGDRILIVPDGLTGRILFSLPVATLVVASLALFTWLRRMLHSGKRARGVGADPPRHRVDEALLKKIARETGESL